MVVYQTNRKKLNAVLDAQGVITGRTRKVNRSVHQTNGLCFAVVHAYVDVNYANTCSRRTPVLAFLRFYYIDKDRCIDFLRDISAQHAKFTELSARDSYGENILSQKPADNQSSEDQCGKEQKIK